MNNELAIAITLIISSVYHVGYLLSDLIKKSMSTENK